MRQLIYRLKRDITLSQVTSMRFLRSPKESLEVAEGQVIGLSCRRRPRHPFIVQRSIILLVASLFKHDVWISLTPDDTVETDFEAGGNGNGRAKRGRGSTQGHPPAPGRSPASRRSPVRRPSMAKEARPPSPCIS